MENKNKILLTGLGLAAVIVPAVLLIVFSGRSDGGKAQSVQTENNRQINQETIQKEVNGAKPSPSLVSPPASPTPTPSKAPAGSTPPGASASGGVN